METDIATNELNLETAQLDNEILNYQQDNHTTKPTNEDDWETILMDESLKEVDPNRVGVDLTEDEYRDNLDKHNEKLLGDIPSREQTRRMELDSVHTDKTTKGFLTKLSQVESKGKYNTPPNKHGYEGKYQHRFRQGDDGRKFMKQLGYSESDINNVEIRRDPIVQEAIMSKAIENYKKDLTKKGIKVTDRTLWYRHNQGAGGTNAIVKGELTSTIRRNIKNQFGKEEKLTLQWNSDADYITNYKNKFDNRF
jgi:hypothetical protein